MSESPQRIGPYRVLQRLGAGGMGEVFLAYDDRLDRRVAIKRIRPDVGISPRRRERFRREARMAARLNHPTIVQVYDILAEEDVDYIVMEYVEGTNLRDLAERGRLPVAQALALARDLASGLDAAHRQGIVHRDFKTENVLVTAAGRAKITDFGIAKQLLAPTDESLTRGNAVLGTYRAMSPEQARGEPVDHRTDLFALGVLLYEVLTGTSPFESDNDLATLNRVIHHHPRAVTELAPAVPAELSALVDHLLQKDPALRPQSAGQVGRELDAITFGSREMPGTATHAESPAPLFGTAADPSLASRAPRAPRSSQGRLEDRSRLARPALLAAVIAFVAALAATGGYFVFRRPGEPLYVAVLPPEVAGQAEDLELLASGVRAALLRGLVALEEISPKTADEMAPVSGSPTQVARAVAADEVVTSRLDCRRETCRVSLARRRGDDGSILWADNFEIPTDDFYLAANAVASQIRRGYADRKVRPGSRLAEATSDDLKAFLRLRQRFDSRRDADLASIYAEAEALRQRSPLFLDVYLLAADVERHRFHDSRNPQVLDHAFDLIRQARHLAPDDPQPLFLLFGVALEGGRQGEAEAALAELQRLAPGDARVLECEALLQNGRGQSAKAIELLRTAVRRHPSWKRLIVLARLESQKGEIAASRGHLNQLLEISPDNFEGMSLLAQVELANGSPERAAELYQRLVRRSPGLAQLSNLGMAYFLLGRYAAAADTFRSAVAREPHNPFYLLNLADASALLGRSDEAQDAYRRVVQLIAADPAGGGTPQFLTVKAQALAHLGQGREAVAAIQEASRLAPSDGDVAYEAALVYAVLGESSSALFNAEKALDLGYDPRWFAFPWFDRLRADPHFRSRLERKPAAV